GHKPLHELIPHWLVALGTVAILALFYALFTFLLNGRSDTAFEALSRLPPTVPVTLARAAPVPPPAPAPQVQKIRQFLDPQVKQGIVTVRENPQTIIVNIRSSGMFQSGSAAVEASFLPLLARIGEAVNLEPGSLQILGHTDNQPIRSLKFPSNFHLSLAR